MRSRVELLFGGPDSLTWSFETGAKRDTAEFLIALLMIVAAIALLVVAFSPRSDVLGLQGMLGV